MGKKKSAQMPISLTEHRKNFVKLLNTFNAHGYNRFNVFNDFLHMAAISIANNADPYQLATDKETFNEREETYKQIISKYKPELQELFPQMFLEIVAEMQTYGAGHFTDVLGELFHHLEFTDNWKGQFFTPQVLGDFMGISMISDVDGTKERITKRGFVTVDDPAYRVQKS